MDALLKFPVTYSLVSSKAIEDELIPLYNLPRSSKALFIHQGINDTYLITTFEAKFILRIYRTNWKTIDDVSAELNLLLLLNDKGISVSYPLPDKSGKLIQKIDCPEGIRFAVIFSHAPGEGLSSLNSQNANLLGQYVGRLHKITEGLKLEGISREYTVTEILTSTKKVLQLTMTSTGEAFERVENIFYQLEKKLSSELLRDVRSGICHGDLHHENIFLETSSGKITLFDFDFCGHGYLIYDLGCFCRYERSSQDNKINFFDGYEKVRPLNQTEKEILPYFEVLMRIFHLGARKMNADGIKNPKWLTSDIETTIYDIDGQLSKIINKI
jgi:Ser/Thr protein kinase RdoA (MazF antagonist)